MMDISGMPPRRRALLLGAAVQTTPHDAARDFECVALLATAIFVESFRPGVLEAMGLAPELLLAASQRLVILRISGWGQTGPYRHEPGFDTLVEGYSGFAAVNGFADREPVLPPMFMGDAHAGSTARPRR